MLPCHVHLVNVGGSVALQERVIRVLPVMSVNILIECSNHPTTPLFVSSAAMAYCLLWVVRASGLRSVLRAFGRPAEVVESHLCDGLARFLLAARNILL